MFIYLLLINLWILCGVIAKDLNEEWMIDNCCNINTNYNLIFFILFLTGPVGLSIVYLANKTIS